METATPARYQHDPAGLQEHPMPRLKIAAVAVLLTIADLAAAEPPRPLLLKPARVFDGVTPQPHAGWVVLIKGDRIEAAGPAGDVKAPADARVLDLPGLTLLPGLIDAHTHLLLHPYNETT